MKKNIDILIINNCPTFYKINLYNELDKQCRIHVVFIGLTNQVVNSNSFDKDINFSYSILNFSQIENRNKFKTFIHVLKVLKSFKFNKIVYGGYVEIEVIILMFLISKKKNCLQFESSIVESNTKGLIGLVKRIIFKRISIALPPGEMQSAVFKALNFKGVIIETKGVGIFNKLAFKHFDTIKADNSRLRYLFVGRLVPVKNLEFLIRCFNNLNKSLTIVGTGVLELDLKAIANSNISFQGFVNNECLQEIYQSNDVFILPSISETWGLVVEESVYYGLPLLISNAVGCQYEMVQLPRTGTVFSPYDAESLYKAIFDIERNFLEYRTNCVNFDFAKRDKAQIDAYLKILTI